MKQLADGGLAFYTDSTQGFKKALKLGALYFVGSLVGFVGIYVKTSLPLSTLVWIAFIFYCFVIVLAFGINFFIQKFSKNSPSCIVYDSYITWKDNQDNIFGEERKLFFTNMQGFFINKKMVHPGKGCSEENVICFVMKDPKVHAPFYPYYAWLSTQDQQLLIKLLKEKGLTFLPEDYKPN